MRELIISRPLDPASPFEAAIIQHPGLSAHSLGLNIAAGLQVSLVGVTGPREGLAALRNRYVAKPPSYVDHVEVVRSRASELVLLISVRTQRHPLDIAGIIEKVLGPETIVSLGYDDRGVTWRIVTLHPKRVKKFLATIGARYNAMERSLARAIPRFRLVSYLRQPDLQDPEVSLTPTARKVWEAATSMRYFERPRGCTLDDIARRTRMPRSTVHYQLREAERTINAEYARLLT